MDTGWVRGFIGKSWHVHFGPLDFKQIGYPRPFNSCRIRVCRWPGSSKRYCRAISQRVQSPLNSPCWIATEEYVVSWQVRHSTIGSDEANPPTPL
jgi:hypothetical protein